MGFEFANPAFLWGTMLAALPLVIHLFNRRRARPHPFAAIDFVLRSRRRTARRLRLKRLLLFLARTLLLLAVPIALARPQPKRADALATPQGPAATAIVVDTSLSMSYQRDGRALLDRAKEMAQKALADLAPEDPVTVVTCEPAAPPPKAPGFDRAEARRAIDAVAQTFMPQDLTACLVRAARALGESTIPAKRILLATDLTAASFRLDVPAPTIQTSQGEVKPEVVLLDAGGGASELPNVAITHLRVEPAPAVAYRAYQFSLTISNYSGEPKEDLAATLKVGDHVVAKGFVDVPARGTTVKTLTYRFPAGGVYSGAVELGGDALAADDARFFTVRVPRDVSALIINGSPHTVRFLDESFFVQSALDAPGSPVRPKLRDADAVGEERFADYDLVLLLNVRELPGAKVRELAEAVANGAGLFVSLGEKVDPDLFNQAFGALLPRQLHLVKTAVEPRSEGAQEKAARLVQVDFEHPALSVFGGEAREGLLSARTYRYFLLSPGAAGQVSQLATYDDGAPALIEGRHGKGRVILYTSTVDREWSDWPIRTSFLPLLQRLAGWLAGTLDERAVEQVRVGEPKPLSPPEGAEGIRFKSPEGAEIAPENADGAVVLAQTELPGVYRADGRIKGVATRVEELDFSVNVDPVESNLARLDERELKAYFGEKTRTTKVAGSEEAAPEVPLWSMLLAAAVGLFFVEGLLARK
ncbi:MAG TPA: hypothetical protein DFS52_12590 [Myxococcales bacterium]|nr:hypothetical protein [Myxococcales bacterium]